VEFRSQIERVFEKASGGMTTEEKIKARNLCKAWKPGEHIVGEIYTTEDGQIWECIQAYNTEHHPGVKPGETAWGTFHKPYHGTSPETALPWVSPTGAHDMYLAGEYMVWIDGSTQRCKQSTNFSPAEYAPAWEVV
jgi:hypothetical protein